jgi:hypothetical protein
VTGLTSDLPGAELSCRAPASRAGRAEPLDDSERSKWLLKPRDATTEGPDSLLIPPPRLA